MTDREAPREEHVTDEEIIARLDETAGGDAGVSRHLAACSACRERLAEMERVFMALRTEPPMPGEAAFATQRERVMAAIEARPRKGAQVHSIRRWWWAPVAAAAAVSGLLLLSLDEPLTPPSDSPADPAPGVSATGATPLPIQAEADQAAEDAFRAVVGSETIGTGTTTAVRIEVAEVEAALAALDAAAPSALTAIADGSALEEEFAGLSAGDQTLILDELSTMTFDL